MFCKYCQIGKYEEFCTCGKSGETCPFVRRCQNEHRWKPLDTMDKCKLGKDEVVVPTGMNKVRFEINGELYVEIGDFVYSIKNPYDYTPEFVEVANVDGEWYVKGFEPKVTPKKKNGGKQDEC
nr:MAG TPA: hypothetical protein [Caudoviricetes sp.]